MKNVAILFGGCSPEYSVSLESACGVIRHLDRKQYTPVLVGISPGGDWYHYTGGVEKIADDTWRNGADCTPAALSLRRSDHKLLVYHPHGVDEISVDVVFPVLHGKNGEDGTVQGLCELAGIPIVGCGTLASALCMDKDRAHKLASLAGVHIPRSLVFDKTSQRDLAREQVEALGYPVFVKPVKAGSSYGITKVWEWCQLPVAMEEAFHFDDQVIVEESIDGFEVGCAVMGNWELTTGELDEIELSDGFFDFREKYNLITSKIHVPARISPETSDEIKQTAKTIYRALGCRGFARVDLFLTPSGEIVFNEVNTIPGFTPHSRFPTMMQAVGMPFENVISLAIELAVRP